MTRQAGTILIHHNRSNPDEIPPVSLRVRDSSNREIFEVFLSPQDLAEALLDQSYQPCTFVDRTEHVETPDR